MLHTGLYDRISNRLALLDLTLVACLPEVLHREDAVGAFEYPLHSRAVFHITLHDLGALLGKGLCLRLLWGACERTNLKASVEEASRHRASLVAARPTHQN